MGRSIEKLNKWINEDKQKKIKEDLNKILQFACQIARDGIPTQRDIDKSISELTNSKKNDLTQDVDKNLSNDQVISDLEKPEGTPKKRKNKRLSKGRNNKSPKKKQKKVYNETIIHSESNGGSREKLNTTTFQPFVSLINITGCSHISALSRERLLKYKNRKEDFMDDEIINAAFEMLDQKYRNTNITFLDSHSPIVSEPSKEIPRDFGTILVPFHIKDPEHWILLKIQPSKATVYDPLVLDMKKEYKIVITKYLRKLSMPEKPIKMGIKHPYQYDNINCGLFVYLFADWLAKDVKHRKKKLANKCES